MYYRRMRWNKFIQLFYNILQTINVLVTVASFICEFPGKYFFCKYIKIHRKLIINLRYRKCRHIRYNNLPRPINSLPGRKYQIRIFVFDDPFTILHFVLSLSCDVQVLKRFVNVIVTIRFLIIDPDECCHPSISMRGMTGMYFWHQFNHIRSRNTTSCYISVFPFIVSRLTYTHYLA